MKRVFEALAASRQVGYETLRTATGLPPRTLRLALSRLRGLGLLETKVELSDLRVKRFRLLLPAGGGRTA